MLAIDQALEAAADYVFVANTPLFVVRKIRSDTTIMGLVSVIDEVDLRKRLEDSLQAVPKNPVERAAPYLYIILSFHKGLFDLVEEAKEYIYFPFYKDIVEFLRKSRSGSKINSKSTVFDVSNLFTKVPSGASTSPYKLIR